MFVRSILAAFVLGYWAGVALSAYIAGSPMPVLGGVLGWAALEDMYR